MTCFECGANATERHHVLPRLLGGTKTVPMCGACHSKVHSMAGDRLKHAELTALGIHKAMNDGSLLMVFIWYSWDILPKHKKEWLDSYRAFTDDDRLSQSQLRKRLATLECWIESCRWDLFRELAEYHGAKWVELVDETIDTHYVQRR